MQSGGFDRVGGTPPMCASRSPVFVLRVLKNIETVISLGGGG